MSINNSAGSSALLGVFFAVLFAFSGLASCGGGGGSATTNYIINASAGPGGTVTPSGATTVTHGASQTYTITPSLGYIIATLVVDGASVAPSATYTFTNVQTGHTISVTFSAVPTYTITASAGPGGTVTPSGATTVTQGASQAYTITQNPGYIIATLVVDGTSVAPSATYTFTDVQTGHTISATFSVAPAGNIVLSLVPARTSGVAPLAVFFDASATTDIGVTTRPFHDLEYRWDFGDATAGTWANGAQAGGSKNTATGPVAAHIFETPGTYTVTLSAADGTNTATTTTTITVDPVTVFDLTTACISNITPVAGVGGCPSGAYAYAGTSDFDAAMSTALSAGYRRILFKRGDTFTGSTDANINVNGPGIIGAYGTGAKPIINGPGTSSIISLGTYGSGLYTDWRIMDLYLNGQNNISGFNVGVNALGQFNQVTILRVDVVGTSSGYAASHWALTSGQQSFDQWAIHDSAAAGVPNCNSPGNYICNWRIYIVGNQFSVQGNYLDGLGDPATSISGGSHIFRCEHWTTSILSNNTLTGAGSFQHAIKLHAWAWGGAGGNSTASTYTEKVLIADNKIMGGANPWLVSIGPQDEIHDERVRDIIFERNWITSNTKTQVGIETSASDSTFRNNIIDLSNAAWHTGMIIALRGIEPTPNNDMVYNNTVYSGTSGDFNVIQIGTATNTTVRNILGSAPLASNPVMFVGSGTGLVQSNNLLNNTPSALFVSATPSVPANFSLRALPNPARDTGFSAIPVFSDFFVFSNFLQLPSRPLNGVIDIGAVEGP